MRAIDIIIAMGLGENAALCALANEHYQLHMLCTEYRERVLYSIGNQTQGEDPTRGFTGTTDLIGVTARYAAFVARYEWVTMFLVTGVAAELKVSQTIAAEEMAAISKKNS